jgi:hypothetical protein
VPEPDEILAVTESGKSKNSVLLEKERVAKALSEILSVPFSTA